MIRWMAEHQVAANLLMIIILFAGAFGVKNIKQEVFPEMDLDLIIVAVPYPGATPDEVEESIILPIEDTISGITGIKKLILLPLRIWDTIGKNCKMMQIKKVYLMM